MAACPFLFFPLKITNELMINNKDRRTMRAEIEAVTQDLKQSLELLRRHL